MRYLTLLLILLTFNSPVFAKGDLNTLSEWMQGGFDSQQQSKQDQDFFNIHLYMKRIWNERDDGIWLYVEQAAEGYLDKPYRQRVYHLTEISDGHYSSEVFSFEQAKNFAGAWKQDKPLSSLSPTDLKVRKGCAVFLKWDETNKSYTGSTDHKKCGSKLRGASYATSKVTVFNDRIESWDQGYDDKDKQVWGAVKSGYVFDRQKSS